jgi:iron complex transport system substrate-binding protein
MKPGILSLLLIVVLGVGFIQSGNYGQRPAKTPIAPAAPRRPVQALGETTAYRRVKHALGETPVPRQPRRIVSLSAAVTDSLVALGIRPVLVESGWKSGALPPYLADGLQGITTVRRTGGISLEALLDAEPDLILVSSTQDAKLYGQLSRIAPTVVFDIPLSGNRDAILLEVGAVLGLPQQAQQRLAAYRRRVERAKAALAKRAGGQSVVFLRFRQHTCVIYAQTTMFGPLLFDQLGLVADAAMPRSMSPGGWDVLSLERLSTLRPAHIFAVVDADSTAYYAGVTATPIWKRIPAVCDGRVHLVAATTWIGGDGVLASEAIMRDVLAAMLPEGTP